MLKDWYSWRKSASRSIDKPSQSVEGQDSGKLESFVEGKGTSLPLFPSDLYEKLPPILREGCQAFEIEQERAMFLLGALGVISGCLPNFIGVYDQQRVGPNLYVFIIAPASAGKGCLRWAKELGMAIHLERRDSEIEEGHPENPEIHFIPANISYGSFMDTLKTNRGRGTLIATEADTLSGALSQDWGNFSDLLRCCFHHESVSLKRKTNKEFIEIDLPFLSVVLSGTPGQVQKLIPDSENGLFSRFCFLQVSIYPKMKNVFAVKERSYEDIFRNLGTRVYALYQLLSSDPFKEIQFLLSEKQQQQFLKLFEDWHQEFYALLGDGSISVVRRLGLICFRIAMVLTILAMEGENHLPATIECTDADFNTAIEIIQVLKEHSMDLYEQLDKTHDGGGLDQRKRAFLENLPEQFERQIAKEVADRVGLPPATMDRFLQSKFFIKVGYGRYQKAK